MRDCLVEQVKNNALWVQRYDKTMELNLLNKLLREKKLLDNNSISIVDVGCGSGRSVALLRRIFGSEVKIYAIDKNSENIEYAKKHTNDLNTYYQTINAFDFFAQKTNANIYDIVFFSWSFFAMSNEPDFSQKKEQLETLVAIAQNCLKPDGILIVLQPTKGGLFEKLLSKFMPESEADYKLVHDFLVEVGFSGAKSAFPTIYDPWAIWSEFKYDTEDDIYCGVASVIYLEKNAIITREYFNKIWENFKKEFCVNEKMLRLTDCVNLYYRSKGELQ